MRKLDRKIAIVTGASQGIGLAIVHALSAEGIRVAGAARTITPQLRDAANLAVSVDLATPEGPQSLVEQTLDTFGGIDLLVNNVGAFLPRTEGFAAIRDDEWRDTFEINFFSAVRTIRAALPSLLECKGSIVNISSSQARTPGLRVLDYATAKAALTNLSKSLAEEFGPQGLRVNTVSPGPTRTPAWESPDGFGAGLAKAADLPLKAFLEDFPAKAGLTTGRLTEPGEVAALVRLLASDEARNIHGADYIIDGGQTKNA